jgi:hypothetical protein
MIPSEALLERLFLTVTKKTLGTTLAAVRSQTSEVGSIATEIDYSSYFGLHPKNGKCSGHRHWSGSCHKRHSTVVRNERGRH